MNPFRPNPPLPVMTTLHSVIHPRDIDATSHDRPQLIDCRSSGEFASGHIPGSINIPLEELRARMGDIDASRPVVFVCASGRRARAAADLVATGTPVSVLDGGVQAWTADGRRLVVNAASTWSIERQVRLAAGSIVALAAAGSLLDPRWTTVPILVGLGLTFAALTNTCAVGSLLMRMPWNRRHS